MVEFVSHRERVGEVAAVFCTAGGEEYEIELKEDDLPEFEEDDIELLSRIVVE